MSSGWTWLNGWRWRKKKFFENAKKNFVEEKKSQENEFQLKNQTEKEESKCSKIIQKWMKQLIANFKLKPHKNRVNKCEKWEIGLL